MYIDSYTYRVFVHHDHTGTPLATFSLGLQLLQEDPDLTDNMREILDLQVKHCSLPICVKQQCSCEQ
jgi:hypothetical protein